MLFQMNYKLCHHTYSYIECKMSTFLILNLLTCSILFELVRILSHGLVKNLAVNFRFWITSIPITACTHFILYFITDSINAFRLQHLNSQQSLIIFPFIHICYCSVQLTGKITLHWQLPMPRTTTLNRQLTIINLCSLRVNYN